MYCSKCGKQNNDTGAFCYSCGSPLQQPPAPSNAQPVAPPIQQPEMPSIAPPITPSTQQQPKQPPIQKPYKTEYVLGLIGSIIGILIFLIIAIVETNDVYKYYLGSFFNTGMIFSGSGLALAAFILGFAGTAKLNKADAKGGILLVVGSGLSFIAVFFGTVGWITMFFFPLLLTGGIMALARKKFVEKNFIQQ